MLRDNWEQKVQELGLVFHHVHGQVYWDESAYYSLSPEQVDTIEDATNELDRLCRQAVNHVVSEKRFGGLGIPLDAMPLIEWSWKTRQPSLYGRMDLAYGGVGQPKLLEFNADTPTALLEASVIQWHWLQDRFPGADQFNSIHERLVSRWSKLKKTLTGRLYFAYVSDDAGEDVMTSTYLRETAELADIDTSGILIEDIGWSSDNCFVDLEGRTINSLFKLYPWEWLLEDQFGGHALTEYKRMNWIEPIWRMVLSNKGLLPLLWELYPGHPNLLEAYFDEPKSMSEYVRKPLQGREGAGVSVVTACEVVEAPNGSYGEPYIYQALAPTPIIDEKRPIIGSWVIDGAAAGIGIRESTGWITDNKATFVPHVIAE